MTFELEIGGIKITLDPAAVSAIRYRMEYGDSIINHLGVCKTLEEAEGLLLRMCHCMVPEANRPELLTLAGLARKDGAFFRKAIMARDALLANDPQWHGGEAHDGEPFDEYRVLALMAVAHIDMALIYELPIMHLVGIVGRYFEAQDPERTTYHKMDDREMKLMYPR